MKTGSYQVKATGDQIDNEKGDVRFGVSAQGREQIAVRIEVTEGPLAGEVLFWTGSFANTDAVEITVRGLRDLGARLDGGRITDLVGLGSRVTNATVREEEWDGKKTWKVQIGGGNFRFKNELDAGGLAALEARLRGGIVAAAQKAPQRGGGAVAPAAGAPGDDIPF